ncbi:type I restriction-modification system specificity subunit S [Nonlabens ulvanivorans]|uniref:Type I restriction-modification system specificity subunit S n=1 Tax=Nonlabens ulvanivorans TaxID=906888 RepID=A0A090Q973_NONUL|nr:restriction endonuclease subunit S [Nonlabens ulvanivorans]GAK99634.1 type I restriction-modification system specificity subunit S [Nonlabens ulvanivorans]
MAAQDNNNSVIASEERAKQSAVLVPQLRFKEFDEEWEESNFGSINTVLDSLHQTPKEYTEQGYPMIRVTDVNDGKLCINKCLKVSKLDFIEFTKRHIPKKGDIIMSRVGTCGASIKLSTDEPVCLGQNTVLLISKIHKHYMFSFMKSRYFQNQVDRMVVGSTQKTLSLRDLKKFKINLPSLKEQQKIATFLTAVDDKISQLTSKKEQLTQYKKGVMQQLFLKSCGLRMRMEMEMTFLIGKRGGWVR